MYSIFHISLCTLRVPTKAYKLPVVLSYRADRKLIVDDISHYNIKN